MTAKSSSRWAAKAPVSFDFEGEGADKATSSLTSVIQQVFDRFYRKAAQARDMTDQAAAWTLLQRQVEQDWLFIAKALVAREAWDVWPKGSRAAVGTSFHFLYWEVRDAWFADHILYDQFTSFAEGAWKYFDRIP